MKKAGVLVLAGLMTIGMAASAFAGTWRQDNGGTWYQKDDGTWPAGAWENVDNAWYYFNQSGYMVQNAWQGDYYLGSDGKMLTNTTTPDGYVVGADGKWINKVSTAVSSGSASTAASGNALSGHFYHWNRPAVPEKEHGHDVFEINGNKIRFKGYMHRSFGAADTPSIEEISSSYYDKVFTISDSCRFLWYGESGKIEPVSREVLFAYIASQQCGDLDLIIENDVIVEMSGVDNEIYV